MSKLPPGWVAAPLMDIVNLHDSRRIPLNQTQRASRRGPYPYYGANGQVDSIDDYLFDGDYILVAEDGGYFDDRTRAVAYEASGKFWVNNHAHILSVRDKIPRRFLTYALNAIDWMQYVGGSTRLKLTQAGMRKIDLDLPPLPEQRRIVAKLDSLFARTRRAREELGCTSLLIEHYKRIILTAAFRGELTADWRQTHLGSEDQPLTEHVPGSWRMRQLQEIAEIQTGLALGKKRKPDDDLFEIPYLRVANVQRGYLKLDEIKTLQATKSEIQRLLLKKGDVLMNEGGDRDKLGRGWIWEGEIEPCIHQNHVFRVRLFDDNFPPRYVSYFANEFGQDYFFSEGTQTTNLASISKKKLSALPLPIPGAGEATEIVARIDRAFGWIGALTNEISRGNQLIIHLDEVALNKAFKGDLVPQDPADEPASVLIGRIRKHRDEEESIGRSQRWRPVARMPRGKRERKQAMGKKRTDVEDNHLSQLLADMGGSGNARELWQRSAMDIDEFYKQLRDEMEAGLIREGAVKDVLELAHAA